MNDGNERAFMIQCLLAAPGVAHLASQPDWAAEFIDAEQQKAGEIIDDTSLDWTKDFLDSQKEAGKQGDLTLTLFKILHTAVQINIRQLLKAMLWYLEQARY